MTCRIDGVQITRFTVQENHYSIEFDLTMEGRPVASTSVSSTDQVPERLAEFYGLVTTEVLTIFSKLEELFEKHSGLFDLDKEPPVVVML